MSTSTSSPSNPATLTAAPASSTSAVRARWQALAPRERQLVLTAVLLVAAALVWWLLLAPAVRTLREAPAQHAQLDAQLEAMQALAMEAQQLKADASNRPSQAQAQRAIQAATASLGPTARATFAGDRATITLQAVPASAIAPWLAQVRGNARSVPVEAHLTRNTTVPPTAMPAARTAFAPAYAGIAGLPSSLAINPVGRAPGTSSTSLSPAPDTAGMPAPASNPAEARWDGRIVLALPAR